MLTAVVLDQRWQDVGARISARVSKFAFVFDFFLDSRFTVAVGTSDNETKFSTTIA